MPGGPAASLGPRGNKDTAEFQGPGVAESRDTGDTTELRDLEPPPDFSSLEKNKLLLHLVHVIAFSASKCTPPPQLVHTETQQDSGEL